MGRNSLPQVAALGELLDRGVWVAPWLGPKGEMVLIGITANQQLATSYTIPNGASRVVASDRVWDAIEDAERGQPVLRLT